MGIIQKAQDGIEYKFQLTCGFQIAAEIDMKLDFLSFQKEIKVTGSNIQIPEYNRFFDKTASLIFKEVTGRACPDSER